MLLKFDELTESVRPVLSESMLGLFDFPVANLTFGLFASVISALSCLSQCPASAGRHQQGRSRGVAEPVRSPPPAAKPVTSRPPSLGRR